MDLNERVSPDFGVKSGIYGEPGILPRVGNEYQVEIPSLVSLSDYLKLSKDSNDSEITKARSIQLVWIIDESETENGFSQLVEKGSVDLRRNCRRPKVQPLGIGHRLVPGCSVSSWSDDDESSLLLGLYMFGKNLVRLKKLIGTKQMGDILSFYYGRFYSTARYKKWSEWRKDKMRKSLFEQRTKHQEFLSRLLNNEAEECCSFVMEMSKAYGDGKIQLDDYIFELKAKFGINALVEAVAIGKGKRDLTGIDKETSKTNIRPEIPTGKACSLLTLDEIVSFLTGGLRLSKTKSNDIFWEAVWPRLLARGWQSEQPGGNFPKNSLVFLVPGIKNISSKNKPVKGEDYYDSVSDILRLVALNPSLLEIDGFASKKENGWTEEVADKSERQDTLPNERHCYLKPRASASRDGDALKFMIVDTSRASGKAQKVMELRTLPLQMFNALTLRNPSSEINYDDPDFENYEINYTSSLNKEQKNKVLKPGMIDITKSDDSKLGLQVNGGKVNGTLAKKRANFKPNENDHSAFAAKKRKRSPVPNGKETCDGEDLRLKREIDGSIRADAPQNPPIQRILIDINVPLSENGETEEASEPKMVERQHANPEQNGEINKVSEPRRAERQQGNPEQEASVGGRRQSTRSRPTTKVLEAFASGFMDPKQKRKGKDDNALKPRAPSKRKRNPVITGSPPESSDPTSTVAMPIEPSEMLPQALIQKPNSAASQTG